MKIGGKEVPQLHEEILVLPRGEDQIVFRARGLSDMEKFEALCPIPKPPGKLTKDGWVPDENDKSYQDVMMTFKQRRLAYMVIHTLGPSQIEWEKVKLDDPSTWLYWEEELKAAGLMEVEINRVIGLVLEANCLNEERLKRAQEAFLRGHQVA